MSKVIIIGFDRNVSRFFRVNNSRGLPKKRLEKNPTSDLRKEDPNNNKKAKTALLPVTGICSLR